MVGAAGPIDPNAAMGVSPAPSPLQPSGFGSGVANFLSNPLVQGALATYLGAIGTPKYEGMGGALSHGGLAGLGAFSQAQQYQRQLPFLQQQYQKGQEEVKRGPYETAVAKEQATQAPMQTQQMKAQLAPISPDEIAKLDFAISAAPTQQEKAYYGFLKQEYQNRRLPASELAQRLDPHMAALLNAQAKMYGNVLGYNYLTGSPLTPPPGVGASPTMPAGAPAPTSPGAAMGGSGWFDPGHTASGPAGDIGYDTVDGHWHVINPDGSKGDPVG